MTKRELIDTILRLKRTRVAQAKANAARYADQDETRFHLSAMLAKASRRGIRNIKVPPTVVVEARRK